MIIKYCRLLDIKFLLQWKLALSLVKTVGSAKSVVIFSKQPLSFQQLGLYHYWFSTTI
jgi:hypothetical protein